MNRRKRAAKRKREQAARRGALLLVLLGTFTMVTSLVMNLRSKNSGKTVANEAMIAKGAQLYAENCITCHGENGGGHVIPEAPALDGSEHAWHHADGQLQRIILDGGQVMPPFRDRLSGEDAAAIIRFIQTWWLDGQLSSQQSISLQGPLQ